jgi:hypothetical protein
MYIYNYKMLFSFCRENLNNKMSALYNQLLLRVISELKDKIISDNNPSSTPESSDGFYYDIPTSITINQIASERGLTIGVKVAKNAKMYFDVIDINQSESNTGYKITKDGKFYYCLDLMDRPIYKSRSIIKLLKKIESEIIKR